MLAKQGSRSPVRYDVPPTQIAEKRAALTSRRSACVAPDDCDPGGHYIRSPTLATGDLSAPARRPRVRVRPYDVRMSTANVFHVALITETENDKENALLTFAEATFVTRFDADRVARAYREILTEAAQKTGKSAHAYRSRVGVLELPAPDPRIGHSRPVIPTAEIIPFIEKARKDNGV